LLGSLQPYDIFQKILKVKKDKDSSEVIITVIVCDII